MEYMSSEIIHPPSIDEQRAEVFFHHYMRVLNETRQVEFAQAALVEELATLADGQDEVIARILSDKYDVVTPLAERPHPLIKIPQRIKDFLVQTFRAN